MIKAVIFDIDGVLLDSYEANLRFYQDLMRKAGYRPPTREEFPKLFHLSLKDAIKALTQSSSEPEILRIWKLGESREVEYPVELLAIPPDAADIIGQLSPKYLLGIVTSRIRESAYEFSELAKMKKYFIATIAYEDTAQHKPHPEPLLLAAKNLGVKPSEAVYIGDVENDIIAAKAAGMKVILYSTKRVGEPDAVASSFRELPALIASL